MKKGQVTFEVTQEKTIAIVTGTKGSVKAIDITDTPIEEKLESLLRDLNQYQKEQELLDAINIDKFKEI